MNRGLFATTIAAAACALLPTGAGAHPAADDLQLAMSHQASGSEMQAKKDFETLDKNKDGTLSMMEAAADDDAKMSFKQLDKNDDYKLTPAEFREHKKYGEAKM